MIQKNSYLVKIDCNLQFEIPLQITLSNNLIFIGKSEYMLVNHTLIEIESCLSNHFFSKICKLSQNLHRFQLHMKIIINRNASICVTMVETKPVYRMTMQYTYRRFSDDFRS